eukprot:scaffold1399_cov109-Cylindrotheca_fusiformis.AAC.3
MDSKTGSPLSRTVENTVSSTRYQPLSNDGKEIRKFCDELMKIDGFNHQKLSQFDYEQRCHQIVSQWEPKFPTIALYVRWAKQSCRDYNMDCISLLNTLADQAGTTPLRFLHAIRYYRWETKSKRCNKPCAFGFSLQFAQKNTRNDGKKATDDNATKGKGGTVSVDKIEKFLIGIKISCCLLNSKMESGRVTTMASTGYRKKKKEDSDVIDFEVVAGSRKESYTGVPRFQTHMLQSFVARVWLEVEFRFLAYEIVKYIFQNMLIQKKAFNDKELDYDDELYGMSIRILNNCKERRMGIQVLCNMCIAFGNIRQVYQFCRELKMFWDDRDSDRMPGRFRDFAASKAGYTDPSSTMKKIQQVFDLFRLEKRVSRNIVPKDKLWFDVIKASTYRYLLVIRRTKEVGTFGATLKDEWDAICSEFKQQQTLSQCASESRPSKRRKLNNSLGVQHHSDPSEAVQNDSCLPQHLLIKRRDVSTTISPQAVSNRQLCKPSSSLPLSDLINASQSRSNTRNLSRSSETPSIAETPTVAVAEANDTNEYPTVGDSTEAELDPTIDVCRHPCTESDLTSLQRTTISSLLELGCDEERLKSLDLATAEELDSRVHSELVVQHPNKVYHLGLAPFEVYSAGELASLAHKREVSSSQREPSNVLFGESDSHEYIGKKKVEYVDPMNVLHVARPNSSIFEMNESVLGDLDIGLLVGTIISSGEASKENGRSPDSIRWHEGCCQCCRGTLEAPRKQGCDATINQQREGSDSILLLTGDPQRANVTSTVV